MPSHEDTLLIDLCTICHIQPPKYRCPRCSARTCSLSCTKRHKLWSQCTGVRDPGAYLKRSELATPKAIDHDFNFISSIERTIERAGVDAEGRGVRLRAGRGNGRHNGGNGGRRLEKGEAALGRALERAGVLVDKAPKGMARSKGNGTRWLNKSKQIAWSVEWRTIEGGDVQHDCFESGTLSGLYESFLRGKEPRTKKRKVRHGAKVGQDETAEETAAPADFLHEVGISDGEQQKNSERPPPTLEEDTEQICEAQTTAELGNKPQEPLPSSNLKQPLRRPSPSSAQQITQKFYLHRPHTPSSQPTVLIPLSASETLNSALQGKVVLEFPTIYVLNETPDELPCAYVTEETYLSQQRKEELTLRHDGIDEREEEGLEEGELVDMVLKGIDEKKVLEVLRKDIGIDTAQMGST